MSLRQRLIFSCILIVVFCLGITSIATSLVLQRYRNQLSFARLDDMTRPIAVQIRSLLRSQTTLGELLSNVQEQSQNNQVWILFVDNKGNITHAIYPDAVAGQSISVSTALPHSLTQSVQGAFSTSTGQKFIYVAYPLGRTVITQSIKAETLILCQPQGGRADVLAVLLRPLFWAGLSALAVSVIIALVIAQSIYRPIRHLSQAAENIAQGKYDHTVPVSGPPEIRELAKNFNLMAFRIKESQLQLRHFVADVSHQLKSPLTSIQGFAQAMLDGTAADTDTRTKAAGIIVDESKRMIRQVNELLELSRMQSGQIKMLREPLDIHEIINQCLDILALRLEEKQLKVRTELNFNGFVMGDADRLEDVISNLLDNAIKNSPPQSLIFIRTVRNPDQALEVEISDEGPGIPPEEIPYLFDRFHQSGGLKPGFGLGLSIAREIVVAHGGRIAVTSNPGQGARFTITLPTGQPSSS
jgi:two-component system, OmpR family, sensor kinase